VVVPDPAMWNLSGGIPFPNSPEAGAESYCVSMFHQLHCIVSLVTTVNPRFLYNTNIITVSVQSALKIALAKATGHITGQRDLPSEDEYDHLLHCNNYLRQSIICAGDTTLEKAKVHSEKRLGVDGMGVSHRCRDWNTIFKFVEDNSPQRFDPKKIQ
jgi:Mycotoxin biosynthesis protein UstYa